jgi:AAA domain (dynein-related subfamily)/CbbQ/NirQ/NorQ C-terminal
MDTNTTMPTADNLMADMVKTIVTAMVTEELKKINLESKVNDTVDATLKGIQKGAIEKNKTIKIKINSKPVEGLVHKDFEKVLKLAMMRLNILCHGEAGSGKTKLAIDVANHLGLNVYSISVNEQTTKTDLVGYLDVKSEIVKTTFRKAYELGGVFALDEIDAGNPNILTVLNSAISNKFYDFADMQVKMHPDFILIATANTNGSEVDFKYLGRNQLDAATLDRFVLINVGYDEKLEAQLVNQETIDIRDAIRRYIKDNNLEIFFSTRSLIQLNDLLANGFGLKEALNMVINAPRPLYYYIKEQLKTSSFEENAIIATETQILHGSTVIGVQSFEELKEYTKVKWGKEYGSIRIMNGKTVFESNDGVFSTIGIQDLLNIIKL